ncbi:lipoyl(octanoyl) transferase LipB [uncultured Friedmanniella sp.]|uniref:lipoyl(octanoyl) transferase LipB n=1 Tax=uncultured Friedmanniella sp. TaxID=335381 RepID=UPI0035CAE96E
MALDFLHLGLGTELCDYEQTWQLQRTLHAEVAAGERPDTVLVLEHAEVYTAGKRTEAHERPLDSSIPVVEVDRGGKITWHGPGQLVVYPIIRLPEALGVVDYVRRLEEAMIALFAEEYGLATGRVRGRSGVWLAAGDARPERKIAAIGVRVASGTTMHGLAINVDPEMSGFAGIVPCGLSDVGVTSMAAELGESPSLPEVTHLLRPHLERYLAFEPYEQSPALRRAHGSDETVDRVTVAATTLRSVPEATYGLTVGAA